MERNAAPLFSTSCTVSNAFALSSTSKYILATKHFLGPIFDDYDKKEINFAIKFTMCNKHFYSNL